MKDLFFAFFQFLQTLNWIDWVVIIICLLYGLEGYMAGLILGFFDIANFFLSFIGGFILYKPVGNFIASIIHAPSEIVKVLSFIAIAVVVEVLLRFIQNKIGEFMKNQKWLQHPVFVSVNSILGIVPGIFSAVLLLTFFLTAFTLLPIAPSIKNAIANSKIGNPLVSTAQVFEKDLASAFGQTPNDLLTFVTVEPEENKTINLHFTVDNGTVDAQAENQMLVMVNYERAKNNKTPLVMDSALQNLARKHSQDMLNRGYFSHYTPEGESPFDRMNAAGIRYTYAGENLALSPNVYLAMQGLMQSPGHRANILSGNFNRIGIGVINAGIYGEMFTQEFTD